MASSDKDLKNFMDKSIDINADTIKKSIEESFHKIMNDPKLKNAKAKLAGMVIGAQTILGNTQAAFAESVEEKVFMRG